MKVRIFDTENGVVTSRLPWKKFDSNKESEKEFMDKWTILLPDFPEECKSSNFIDVEESLIPLPEDSNHQLFFDGEISVQNLKRDKDGAVKIYPLSLLRNKFLKEINSKIDTELEKESPDSISIVRLQREKEKLILLTDKELYEKAIAGLDERVAGGEPDKPLIREKLQAKIKELGGE